MDTKEIETRVAKARELHEKGMNCCQAVVMAYADKLPIEAENAMKMASPFGRGMSGLRETCGCVTGMAMVCGLCDHTMMVKGLGNRFREENGDLNCFKLLQLQGKDHSCNDLVACAARLIGETL
jgi:C_GCAxxG_C_C family probable redox protein